MRLAMLPELSHTHAIIGPHRASPRTPDPGSLYGGSHLWLSGYLAE